MEHLPLPKPPKSCVFRLVPNSQLHINKANNASEVFDNEGAYWEFEIELTNVPESDALELDGFLASLRGSVGRFLMHDYRREQERLDTTAYVYGGYNDGAALPVTNLPAGQVYARAGEKIQIGTGSASELKILTENVLPSATGTTTLRFESPLRRIPAHNTPVCFVRPAGVFRLIDNKQGLADAQYKNGVVTSWRIRGREAF
ncbi:hypothetical protein [Pseudoalteromonas piscicida]|uniref:Uncharacterized protein n=1 Tax=Pseudoalteromonas piscicida TaxID=43662 RepID=A0A2A5JMI1_PSEO7|nr:hypothetical protein [Pseudoalteromonas piscicida]PCK30461.1 hypothetical protein CEX98_17725 [Pseudoalteromonas piscicida]